MIAASGSSSNCLANSTAGVVLVSSQPSVATRPSRASMPRTSWCGNLAHGAKPIGFSKRLGADDDAIQAQIEQLADRCFVANAAAKFAGDFNGRQNRTNAVEIGRPSFASAVEIDQMEALGPLADQTAGGGGGIVVEDRFAAIVSLLEADTFAAAQVDGRPNLHGRKNSPQHDADPRTETRNMAQDAGERKRDGGH